MALWQDVRFTLRGMAKARGLTVVALLTLAIGIGANTAIFSIVNAVLLQPLPFRDPGQLVQLRADLPGVGANNVGFSGARNMRTCAIVPLRYFKQFQ